jgi:EAL domain-containing protein (putative c-di-GMP-specific phosphodiesterase class I)
MIMRNIEQSIETLTQLRAAGMQVAVDDFGVGYSSLNQLTRLPASSMKIDRSFISNLPATCRAARSPRRSSRWPSA